MFKVTNYIGAILYLLLSHTALQAQTAQMPAAEDFSTGEVVESTPAISDYYAKGSFGDWTLRCLKTEQAQDPCQLFQLMHTPDGSPVAEYNLNPIQSDGLVIAGANVITPLETLLTQQLTIQVDDENAKIYIPSHSVCKWAAWRASVSLKTISTATAPARRPSSPCFPPRPQRSPNALHYL